MATRSCNNHGKRNYNLTRTQLQENDAMLFCFVVASGRVVVVQGLARRNCRNVLNALVRETEQRLMSELLRARENEDVRNLGFEDELAATTEGARWPGGVVKRSWFGESFAANVNANSC